MRSNRSMFVMRPLPALAAALALLLALSVVLLPSSASSFNYHNYDSLTMDVLSPPNLVGPVIYTPGVYGASLVNPAGADGMELEIVLAYPDPTGCSDLGAAQADGVARTRDGRTYEGKIMMIVRGECTFSTKSVTAEVAGATVALIYACSAAPPTLCKPERDSMESSTLDTNLTSLMIDWTDGDLFAQSIKQCDEQRIHGDDPTGECAVRVFIQGTGPIAQPDRDALTQISVDMIFDYMTSSASQSGPLPPFSSIRDPKLDPCVNRVAGIWCQGSPGRVVRLDLDNLNLTGILSPAIGQLTALQQLIISNNNFFCTSLHCTFNQLTELRVLMMFHMHMESFEPPNSTCLGGMYNLVAVDASYNEISSLTESMFNWTNVRAFDISNNAITTELSSDLFSVLPALEFISFANNFIFMDLEGVDFAGLFKIQHLDLSSNRVTGSMGWYAFDGLTELLHLDLSNNDINGRLPGFTGTNNINWLDMGGNELEGNCTNWFMPDLKYLSLGANRLSEPLERFPARFESLQYLDVSSNRLTINPAVHPDVGAFLFELLPRSIQTVHLEHNQLAGPWGSGFMSTFYSLSHFYLNDNWLTVLPGDLFKIGGVANSLIDLDLSNNRLVGVLPSTPPSPLLANLKFQGNPGLVDPNLQLPTWAKIDPKGSFVQPTSTDSYTCPSLIGTSFYLSVTLDPSYYGYSGCQCSRGTYGHPPVCLNIPSVVNQHSDAAGSGSFTDEIFGSKRFFEGIDTSFVIGYPNLTFAPGGPTAPRSSARLKFNGSAIEEEAEAGGALQSDGIALRNSTVVTPHVVRAIYVTIKLNRTNFLGQGESLTVFTGGADLRGTRVVYWQGSERWHPVNIDLAGRWPVGTVTILGAMGVINFRSRDSSGSHFRANYTMSDECPPLYLVQYDDHNPQGFCALPPEVSSSTIVLVLLTTSVIIGVLALCLLGQKMSTIQGLINGHSLQSARNGLNRRQQAEEIYGPVLSVEETWRRQLKRDLLKEALMLGLELAGYLTNWLVVIEELHHTHGSFTSDRFLVAYMLVVVLSTVTGCLSLYARVRVMREIWSELHLGLAVVPSIATLLHTHKSGAGPAHAHQQQYQRQQQQQQQQRQQQQHPARGGSPSESVGQASMSLLESSTALGPSRDLQQRKKHPLASFGQPLLPSDSIDASDLTDENSVDSGAGMENLTQSTISTSSSYRMTSGSSTGPVFSSSQQRQGSFNRGASSSNSSGGSSPTPATRPRSPSILSMRSSTSADEESEQLKVRLSSKDPNVQLAWVQRTISTTKLTSFNLIFSTLPFLVLNQLRVFRNDSIRRDWALQLSSLFATVLLGVKLLRIFALGELLQRRNELVFEVVIAGTGQSGRGGGHGPGHGHGQNRGEQHQQGIKIQGNGYVPSHGSINGSMTPAAQSYVASSYMAGSMPHFATSPQRTGSGLGLGAGGGGGGGGGGLAPPAASLPHHTGRMGSATFSMGPGASFVQGTEVELLATSSLGSMQVAQDGSFVLLDGQSVSDWNGGASDFHVGSSVGGRGAGHSHGGRSHGHSHVGSSHGGMLAHPGSLVVGSLPGQGPALHAPPSSLSSPLSTHLFAPAASFASASPFESIAEDDAAMWAQANAGSSLVIAQPPQPPQLPHLPQLHQLASVSEDERQSDFLSPPPSQYGPGGGHDGVVVGAGSLSPRTSGSSSGTSGGASLGTTNASSTASAGASWIQQHMLAEPMSIGAGGSGASDRASPSAASSPSGSHTQPPAHMSKLKKRTQIQEDAGV